MAKVLGLALAIVGLAAGVHLLREATMSTHYATDASSRLEVVVRAQGNRAEPGVTLRQMTVAQLDTCALEVKRSREGDVEEVGEDGDRFRVVLQPALDSTDRKQYEGCLEDWVIAHLQLRVESMTDRTGR